MIQTIFAPKHSANDETMTVVAVRVADGGHVRSGTPILDLEGAKAVVEVEATAEGIIHLVAAEGQQVAVGAPVAVIASPDLSRAAALAELVRSPAPAAVVVPVVPSVEGARFSRAAWELISRHGLDDSLFAGRGLVNAAMVEALLAERAAGQETLMPVSRDGCGRILLAGAGPGAYQLLSVLAHQPGTRVVGLLDDDPAKRTLSIKGVPVIGPLDEMFELADKGAIDSVVCTTPTSIAFRVKVAELARRAGLRQANVIHPTAVFDDGVLVGEGNFFGAFCFVGAETRIGNYGFFSSRTTFEHHNRIGNGVTTGPTVATSGTVSVSNHVKFGTGVVVEPNLTIGEGAVIASGSVVVTDVSPGQVLKARVK